MKSFSMWRKIFTAVYRSAVIDMPMQTIIFYPSSNPVQMEEQFFMLYLDANNLYGWKRSESLPLKDFQWSDIRINVIDIPDDSEAGY